jgi:putative membrane protein
MFIVLYYDKNERFGILGINSTKRVQRTLAYHGLATLSAIILGITLNLFLDFEITNIFLYYISLILIANAFMAIMNFLITNFGDIGKFLGLIILVLQLASSGGTFPIETVTKGFRWLNPLLPMTYTNKLMKESLVAIESNLLTKYILIVLAIFLVFLVINISLDIYRTKKDSEK